MTKYYGWSNANKGDHTHATHMNTITELKNLVHAANDAYLAFYASTLNAPSTPEFARLRFVNDALRQAVVRAKNQITIVETENDLSPQAAAVAKLERDGFQFSNWIPYCPNADNEPSDSDPRMTAVMVKRRLHGREYREVEPDGTVN